MALIVYSANELVTLDLHIQSFQRHNVTIDGYRLVSLACLGPYRLLSELTHLLFGSLTLTRSDLARMIKHNASANVPFTCLLQCAEKVTGKPQAFQISRPEDGLVEIGAANPTGRAVKYCGKPGVPFTTLTPPMLAEAPMCALTFTASRAATLPDMGKHNMLRVCTQGMLQEFTLTEILERFDNTARVARIAI